MKQQHASHQDQLQWLMTPCPRADQSIETNTLRGILRKLINSLLRSSSKTSPEVPTFREQIKPLKNKDTETLSLSLKHTHTHTHTCAFFPQAAVSLWSTSVPFLSLLSFKARAFALLLNSKGPSFASGVYFLSPCCPAGSLFLLLWISK